MASILRDLIREVCKITLPQVQYQLGMLVDTNQRLELTQKAQTIRTVSIFLNTVTGRSRFDTILSRHVSEGRGFVF